MYYELLLKRFVVDDNHIIEIHLSDEIRECGLDGVRENERTEIREILHLTLPIYL